MSHSLLTGISFNFQFSPVDEANILAHRFDSTISGYSGSHSGRCHVIHCREPSTSAQVRKWLLLLRYIDLYQTRCRAKNLLVPTMLPGPKEPDADQLQEYLRIIVDDLIKLFYDGIRVPTPSSPEGA